MKKLLVLLLFVSVLFISACASGDFDGDYNYEPGYGEDTQPPSNRLDDYFDGDVEPVNNIVMQVNRKLIYTVNLGLVTPTPSAAYEDALALLSVSDGFIQNESLEDGVYAVTLRVRSDLLDAFVKDLRDLGETVHYKKTSQDVTNSYSTLSSRLDALNAQHIRILELIEEAETLADLLTLEAMRADVDTELRQIGSQLNNYDSLIEYSTVTLVITEIDDWMDLLDKTVTPGLGIDEIGVSTAEITVRNNAENDTLTTLKLYDNGILVETKTVELVSNQRITVTFEDLNADSQYYIKATSIEDGFADSDERTIYFTTDSTYFSLLGTVFNSSINALGIFVQGLGIVVVALIPFMIVGAIGFVPAKLYYNKKIKPKRFKKLSEAQNKRESI